MERNGSDGISGSGLGSGFASGRGGTSINVPLTLAWTADKNCHNKQYNHDDNDNNKNNTNDKAAKRTRDGIWKGDQIRDGTRKTGVGKGISLMISSTPVNLQGFWKYSRDSSL
ncbi:uncharacterized protein [Drosophila bipectinata]|uniref:uncharacterized protein isoform X2 n=1 Tax=Drosophila bipectinata TaxID=42026 RepID=UPI0038B36CDF